MSIVREQQASVKTMFSLKERNGKKIQVRSRTLSLLHFTQSKHNSNRLGETSCKGIIFEMFDICISSERWSFLVEDENSPLDFELFLYI